MSRACKILLLILVSFGLKAQTQHPNYLPNPNAPAGYYRVGYLETVKGLLFVERDTFCAKYPTIIKHTDHNFYYTNGNCTEWFPLIPASDSVVSFEKNISNDSAILVLSDGRRFAASDNGMDTALVSQIIHDSLIVFNTGLIEIPQIVSLATVTALPLSVYDNGAGGIGATITGVISTPLVNIDGVDPALDTKILVKDQADSLQNGVYIVTQLGSVDDDLPFILTRVTNSDETGELFPQAVTVAQGDVNATFLFVQETVDPVVGSDKIIYGFFTDLTPEGQRFGIEDNLGIQNRAVDMQAFTFTMSNVSEFQVATPGVGIFSYSDGSQIGGTNSSFQSNDFNTNFTNKATAQISAQTIDGSEQWSVYVIEDGMRFRRNLQSELDPFDITVPAITDDYYLPLTVNNIPADAAGNITLTGLGNDSAYIDAHVSTDSLYLVLVRDNGDSTLINWVTTGGGGIQSVVAGTNVTVDNTDPLNPIVSASGGGGSGAIGNIGGGYRWMTSDGTLAKTVIADWGINADSSSNVNSITLKADSSEVASQYDLTLKQNLITLTTTGTSGASTFDQLTGALNIPIYASGIVRQIHTAGTAVTVADATTWLIVNPATILASLVVTLPATPTDKQDVLISFGGTITVGGVVTAYSVSPVPIDANAPDYILSGDHIQYRWDATNSLWYRVN